MDGLSLRPTHWIGLVSMGKLPVTTQGPISIIRHSMLLVFLFFSISNSLLLLLRYAIFQIAEIVGKYRNFIALHYIYNVDKPKGGNVMCKCFLSKILRLFCSVLIPWSRFDLYIEDNSSTQSRPTYGSPVLLDSHRNRYIL